MDLYIYSPIRLHGVMLNSLSTGTTLPITYPLNGYAKSALEIGTRNMNSEDVERGGMSVRQCLLKQIENA
jgi:hypothetical protein